MMNSSQRRDSLSEAVLKNFIAFSVAMIINCINGAFVVIYFKSKEFQSDPRYVLYIHMVINDMILLSLSIVVMIISYTARITYGACFFLLLLLISTDMVSPLNLAGMSVERYVAICHPLHHVQMCTVQRAYGLIALIWGIALIPALSEVFIFVATKPLTSLTETTICYQNAVFNTPHHRTSRLGLQVVYFSFISLTVVITYLRVFFAARGVSTSQQAVNKTARNTILLHGIQLCICMFSFVGPMARHDMVNTWPQQRSSILFATFMVTNVLTRLLSPLIYGLRDKKFSSHIKQNLYCKWCSSVGRKLDPAQARRQSRV